jgi:phosphatidylserine decarboxylase
MGMDTEEAEYGLADYGSFAELFSRRLRPGSRPIDPDAANIVCPADGRLTAFGRADRGRLIQAKGLDYDLQELVVDPALAQALEGGPFITVYLRPKDYHRVHSPVNAEVVRVSRVGGHLLPVKPAFVRGQPDLYVRNERVVMDLDGEAGRMALVCVGAAAVGSITTVFDDDGREATAPSRRVERGQEVAAFNLGSTVVLIAQQSRVDMGELLEDCELRVGQRVGRRL